MNEIQKWAVPSGYCGGKAWEVTAVSMVTYADHVKAVEEAKRSGYGKAEYDLRMVGPDSFDLGWHNGYDSGYRAGLAALENLEKDLKNFENILEYIKANKPEKF
jgi:hypothetical protein